jgi:hypothetical protein
MLVAGSFYRNIAAFRPAEAIPVPAGGLNI